MLITRLNDPAALIGIRGAKSTAKVSMRAELSRVEISGPEALVRAVELAADDLERRGVAVAAVRAGSLVVALDMSGFSITVTRLADGWLDLWRAPTDAPAWREPAR